MNVRKMLRREAETVVNDKMIGKRNDATDILISIRFSDNHIHHILPQQPLVDAIVEDLLNYSKIQLQPQETETVEESKKAPKEVIFHNRQAFGDILTMTSGARDFKMTYPNTRVGVITTAMHIWDNNPHIDHQFRSNDNRKIVKIGPGMLTNKSNLWNYHMTNAFRMDMENKMGLRINQGEMRPDIWLTQEEYDAPPLIDGAYWVFIYGGEPGWPSKQYHRWQEVIDILKDDIQFVQLGVKGHPYPRLENVIDYVGKTEDRNTGIRNLFNIFLHAQGSLGLVSMHMHLSACFNNPCVTGNTLIVTENGLNFPINLIDKKFKAIVDGKLYNSNGFWKTGTKKLLELNFKFGRQLVVTHDHQIMTSEGWKKAKDVKLNEHVIINNHRSYDFNIDSNSRDYAKGYCLGNLLSDGHVNKTSAIMMWFGKNRVKYHKDGMKLMDQAGWALSRRYRAKDNGISTSISSTNLYDFAVERGSIINGKKKFTKTTLVGNWSYISGLIAGYFDGDGTVNTSSESGFSASISSVKKNNLKFLQIALSALGIYSKIYINKKTRPNSFNKKYKTNPLHRLVISGDNIKEFIKNIHIRNKDKLDKLKIIEENRKRKANVTNFYDILINISEKEKENVYDCEVDDVHSFDADSIYVHNCVVVAGAREPAWFTQYFGHQYVQTNGTMECSETRACWACKLEGCKNLVKPDKINKGHNTKQVPKCVDIIEPEEIAEAVRKYYKGGRLEYGKKVPNTFFQNIVKEKKIFVTPTPDQVDEELLKKYGFQWGGGCITDRDWMFMKEVIDENKVKNILEFGAGLSSLLFGTVAEKIITFEDQQGWIKKINDMADETKNHFFHWDGKELAIDDFKEEGLKFDMAFVDGPAGSMNREWSTKYASELADIVIVHDAGRQGEKMWQEKYLASEFELVAKGGHRCHLWMKKEICQAERDKVQVEIENDDRPSFRMVTTCRGYGGSERSSIHIMKMFLEDGYRVELIPTGNVSGEYLKNIPKGVIKRSWLDIMQPIDILTFYTSDCIWNFDKPQYMEVMDKLQVKKKVMILNYQLGGAGTVEWTLDWNKYMFLNSTKESELKERIPNAVTKVLPPPTDLTEFFKVDINYNPPLKLIRHNSQRDAKHPDYTNDLITQILNIDNAIRFFYMPAWSQTFDHDNVFKFKVNEIPVPEFLSKGNCFWYHLPPSYQDQGPRVILEAMACGLPVIADNRYGAKDRVTEETGWLCEDVTDYLEVIEEIVNNIDILKTKGEAARELAKAEYVPIRWHEEIKNA